MHNIGNGVTYNFYVVYMSMNIPISLNREVAFWPHRGLFLVIVKVS